MLDLSVIIATYNSTEDLDNCLQSIEAFTKDIDYEVIVVDNNSPDRSCLQLEKKYPKVKFFFLTTNNGFGAANNYGFKQSKGEYVLFLNPDTMLLENSFKTAVEFMEQHPAVGALGLMQVYPDLGLQYCYGYFPGILEELLITVYLDKKAHERLVQRDFKQNVSKQIPFSVDWVAGSCLMTRRGIMEKIGGFNERYFLFYEDADLCARIKADGWQIYYLPITKIIHCAGISTSSNHYILVTHRYRSKYIYVSQHLPFLKRVVVHLLTIVGLIFRYMATFVFKYGSPKEKYPRRKAYLDSMQFYLSNLLARRYKEMPIL